MCKNMTHDVQDHSKTPVCTGWETWSPEDLDGMLPDWALSEDHAQCTNPLGEPGIARTAASQGGKVIVQFCLLRSLPRTIPVKDLQKGNAHRAVEALVCALVWCSMLTRIHGPPFGFSSSAGPLFTLSSQRSPKPKKGRKTLAIMRHNKDSCAALAILLRAFLHTKTFQARFRKSCYMSLPGHFSLKEEQTYILKWCSSTATLLLMDWASGQLLDVLVAIPGCLPLCRITVDSPEKAQWHGERHGLSATGGSFAKENLPEAPRL